MKHFPPSASRHRLAVLAAAIGLAVLTAPAAHAFTIEDQSNASSSSNGAARYTDPDARFSGYGSATTIQQGNTTLRYGGQMGSFDQRYDQNRMFQPNALQGRDDR